jgi:hypothetical protein
MEELPHLSLCITDRVAGTVLREILVSSKAYDIKECKEGIEFLLNNVKKIKDNGYTKLFQD